MGSLHGLRGGFHRKRPGTFRQRSRRGFMSASEFGVHREWLSRCCLQRRGTLSSSAPYRGWILYDGSCGFCYWWVHFWQKVVAKRGFALKDLQTALADGTLTIEKDRLLDDIRVLDAEGRLICGADAYLYVAKRIWWALPFYAL